LELILERADAGCSDEGIRRRFELLIMVGIIPDVEYFIKFDSVVLRLAFTCSGVRII